MNSIKLYSTSDHYDPRFRGELIDLLKPFWGKPDEFTDEQRLSMYGLSEHDFGFTNLIPDSDLVVLPMSWNYYQLKRKLPLAIDLINEAEQDGKKVLSWTSGDFGVRVPHFENLVVLRSSGYRSKLPDYHQGMPVFFFDPLKRLYNHENTFMREKGNKPVIGFCGQANGNMVKYTKDISRTLRRNAQYFLGLSNYQPQDWYPSTLRRARILEAIEKDDRLTANFIKRSQYRAGAQNVEERRRTTQEFYDNMVQSDYVVCVRGGGNFSVRLYETLSMGRIPVFVNTDCLLPLSDSINWKEHVVWVEEKEIGQVGDMILEFHEKLRAQRFRELQRLNRELWASRLRLGAFLKFGIERWVGLNSG